MRYASHIVVFATVNQAAMSATATGGAGSLQIQTECLWECLPMRNIAAISNVIPTLSVCLSGA